MTQREAYDYGRHNGYAIARENASEAGSFGALVSLTLETEADHFRQFSPFEFFAAEVNATGDRADGIWAAYERGVARGAREAAREVFP